MCQRRHQSQCKLLLIDLSTESVKPIGRSSHHRHGRAMIIAQASTARPPKKETYARLTTTVSSIVFHRNELLPFDDTWYLRGRTPGG